MTFRNNAFLFLLLKRGELKDIIPKQKKRMLITGVSGLLGNNLAVYFRDKYEILGLYHSNDVEIDRIVTVRADLRDAEGLGRIIGDFRPDILIHCASLTDVEGCETDTQNAYEINVTGTKNIVDQINDQDTCLVYIVVLLNTYHTITNCIYMSKLPKVFFLIFYKQE